MKTNTIIRGMHHTTNQFDFTITGPVHITFTLHLLTFLSFLSLLGSGTTWSGSPCSSLVLLFSCRRSNNKWGNPCLVHHSFIIIIYRIVQAFCFCVCLFLSFMISHQLITVITITSHELLVYLQCINILLCIVQYAIRVNSEVNKWCGDPFQFHESSSQSKHFV
jgi:hypothetical protein